MTEANGGQAFAWSPGGPQAIAPDGTPAAPAPAHSVSSQPSLARVAGIGGQGFAEASREWLAPPASRTNEQRTAAKPLRPRDVVRAAKARVREIRAELKRLGKLQTELAELVRLLDAADGKKLGIVRSLKVGKGES